MSDNFMEKVSSFGRKVSAGMSSASFKMREFFQGQNMADQIVEEATAETLGEPDLLINLEICDMINHERVNSVEVIRGIKKRIMLSSHRVQYLAMVLLESLVSNCKRAFPEIAAERVFDEMVKVIDDPHTIVNNRNKALMLIQAWGESSAELPFLPAFDETYKSLKSRGIRFPDHDAESLARICTPASSASASESSIHIGRQVHHDKSAQTFSAEQIKEAFDVARNSIELLTTVLSSSPQQEALVDEVTTTLVQQCCLSQKTVQRIIETAADNDGLLFEALNVNDEIQKILSVYMDMKKSQVVSHGPENSLQEKPAISRGGAQSGPNNEMDDLDEMILRRKSGGESENGQDSKKEQTSKDDLISF